MDPIIQSVLAAAASFFVIALIFGLLLFLCKTTNRRRDNYNLRHIHHRRTVPNTEQSIITIDETFCFDPSLNRISMDELKLATKNFSADLIIGDGSFGLVYKATLSTGITVAIKKLDQDAFQGFREFHAEMDTLGKLRHKNIVKILGYCVSGLERVLIYEFVEKGSLDFWLHDTSTVVPLTWDTRNRVVRGIANGLEYLHGLETPIIHRDIKASNVLLDSEFQAHIADFGLARRMDASRSHVSTQVAGTMGYMPPEYKEGVMPATIKADVYSFGILMFEIATVERPNLPVPLDGTEVELIEWTRQMLGQNRHMEMLDKRMGRTGVKEEKVKEYFRIASLCCSEAMKDRPAMRDVVSLLKQLNDS